MAGRIDRLSKILLSIITVALVAIAASSISGRMSPVQPAWAVVNPAEQRLRMIQELERLNTSASRILALLESGKLRVVAEEK